MSDLLRQKDLEENPTTRVPVCLCLDVSNSPDRVVGGQTRDTGRTIFSDGRQWNIVEGGVSALDELKAGVNLFYDNLLDDDVARYAAQVCIVTFGGKAQLVLDERELGQARGRTSAENFRLDGNGSYSHGRGSQHGSRLPGGAQGRIQGRRR